MSANCRHCGQRLTPAAAACPRCGLSRATAADGTSLQYGMVELGSAGDLAAPPPLDLDETAPAQPARRTPTRAGTQRRADSGPVGRAANAPRASASTGGQRAAAGRASAASADAATARANNPNRSAIKGRAAASSQSNTKHGAANPATAQAARVNQAAATPYSHGMMLDDDPFNQAFGAGESGTALQLDSEAVEEQNPIPSPQPAPPPVVESPAEARARQIAEIAGYGSPPAKLTGTPLYCARVLLRKRVLSEELASLSAQRKRADDVASEALASMGEALYAQRNDPALEVFGKLFAAVGDAEDRVGHVEAAGQKRREDANRELARLDRELARLEQAAAPLRERESAIDAELERYKAEGRRIDLLRKKLEGELEALRRTKTGLDPERLAALQAERDARHGELQTLGVQMRPIEEDLGGVRRELKKYMRAISTLQADKQGVIAANERAQQNHRVSFGSARGARVQALGVLAGAALKQGLDDFATERAREAREAAQRAERKRQQEELHRTALNSYDHKAYSQGLTAMLGGSLLLFLSLALAILL